jgi:hypothetical protein
MDTILLIGSGNLHYCRYILAGISRRYRVVLVATDPITWETPYRSDHVVVPGENAAALAGAVLDLAARHPVKVEQHRASRTARNIRWAVPRPAFAATLFSLSAGRGAGSPAWHWETGSVPRRPRVLPASITR